MPISPECKNISGTITSGESCNFTFVNHTCTRARCQAGQWYNMSGGGFVQQSECIAQGCPLPAPKPIQPPDVQSGCLAEGVSASGTECDNPRSGYFCNSTTCVRGQWLPKHIEEESCIQMPCPFNRENITEIITTVDGEERFPEIRCGTVQENVGSDFEIPVKAGHVCLAEEIGFLCDYASCQEGAFHQKIICTGFTADHSQVCNKVDSTVAPCSAWLDHSPVLRPSVVPELPSTQRHIVPGKKTWSRL